MKFSLNNQSNNFDGVGTKENRSIIDEGLQMTDANDNIQLLNGTTGAFKNTLRLIGGLALAGVIAMTTTFGSISADEPASSRQ